MRLDTCFVVHSRGSGTVDSFAVQVDKVRAVEQIDIVAVPDYHKNHKLFLVAVEVGIAHYHYSHIVHHCRGPVDC